MEVSWKNMCACRRRLPNRILEKAHKSEFTVHPEISKKMYWDLKGML